MVQLFGSMKTMVTLTDESSPEEFNRMLTEDANNKSKWKLNSISRL